MRGPIKAAYHSCEYYIYIRVVQKINFFHYKFECSLLTQIPLCEPANVKITGTNHSYFCHYCAILLTGCKITKIAFFLIIVHSFYQVETFEIYLQQCIIMNTNEKRQKLCVLDYNFIIIISQRRSKRRDQFKYAKISHKVTVFL